MQTLNLYNSDALKSNIVSNVMYNKIVEWNRMLKHETETVKKFGSSGILMDIAKTVSDPINEEVSVVAKNEKLDSVIKKLNEKNVDLVQNMALRGSCLVRPIYANGKTQFEIIPLGNYLPTSYDFDGTLTGAKIIKSVTEKNKEYALVENHVYSGAEKTHTVTLELFNKEENGNLKKVSLQSIESTRELAENFVYSNCDCPLMIEFRNRDPNYIDGSNVPVNIFSGDESLISDAEEQYNNFKWEQKAGRTHLFADVDMFKPKQGEEENVSLPVELHDVVVKYEGYGTGDEKIQTVSPTLRTTDQINAFNEILRRIENRCRIGKGSLSNLSEAPQTATQYTGGKATLYHTVDVYESELEEKYLQSAYCFAYLLNLYEDNEFNYDILISYNDAGRKDPEKVRLAALQEVQNGIISEAEYRMRVFGEDEETALSKVPEKKENTNSFADYFGA